MISDTNLKKLEDSSSYLFGFIQSSLDAFWYGMENYDFWMLKILQDKVPFLKFISDDRLAEIGPVILERLKSVALYPGIISILKALYPTAQIFIDSYEPGTLEIDISGASEDLLSEFILNSGENFALKNGDVLELQFYSSDSSVDFDDFISNFILAGVHLTEFDVNPQKIFEILTSKEKILTHRGNILGKEKKKWRKKRCTSSIKQRA